MQHNTRLSHTVCLLLVTTEASVEIQGTPSAYKEGWRFLVYNCNIFQSYMVPKAYWGRYHFTISKLLNGPLEITKVRVCLFPWSISIKKTFH